MFYLLIIFRGDGFLVRKLAFSTGLEESCWWQERQVLGGHAPQSNPQTHAQEQHTSILGRGIN